MATAPLRREEADQRLTAIGAEYDRLAAAMYALDSHPALRWLRAGGATGATAERLADLPQRVSVLWAHFSVAGDLLEAARAARARHGRPTDDDLAELTALLREPMVALDEAGLPADGTGGPVARRLCLVDLIPMVLADAEAAGNRLAAVQGALTALTDLLSPTADAVDAVATLGTEFGATDLVRPLTDELDAVRGQALGDPLAGAPDGTPTAAVTARLGRLDAAEAAARSRLSGLVALRDDYAGRRAAWTDALTALAEAEHAAAAAYRATAAKIADPGLPPVPAAAERLRGRLANLDELHRGAAWPALADAVAATEREIAAAADRARELHGAADGLLARREELRGRLTAYRAKAAALGRLEDPEVARRYGAAERLLYTAPCDLPAATRAVYGYQQALSELARQREGSA
ncbi:hypothetical protein [Actinocatenispora thailandica]|uniref:hypothetical protein n=1 Tax=Actinocatenispora thailandica TaxID=227318 RepID=UPI0031DD498D